ncbi:YbaB/EbfC family nucleoid-associated protein [Prauserella alba]|uniref:YbaB/EbfC DNA-binding family protein n=1 Tax=Prauserella alba TaxID=176898 RepID=A0ABN1VTP9_9PSEU|nr:YbaB/EbfC family nucleoid-associated protein [Prauserella alba]MCP2179508.1 YbaB/EbfC DNA-binding family protein [Prauserella alba]
MTDPGQDLMRRIEAIDTAAADNARAAEAYRQVTEELAEVTGTATSEDGVVTVVATADGGVSRVRFTGGVRDVAPETLSASVTHTIAQARYAAARRQAEVVRRGFGDTDLLDRVLDADARVFGDRRPADPGPPPEPQYVPRAPSSGRAGGRGDYPEPYDYSEFSYLRRGR